eukprot:4850295-Pyramimonas_sp.AAC.1
MFSTATWAHLRELSECGRMAKLWVRFQRGDMGNMTALRIDQEYDPSRTSRHGPPPLPRAQGATA